MLHAQRILITPAALLLAAANGLAQPTFTPVSDLPGVVEPPPDVIPINAGQVICGLAPRYYVKVDPPGAPYWQAWSTADFITMTPLPLPQGAFASEPISAADSGWPLLGQLLLGTPTNTIVRPCIWSADGGVQVFTATGQTHQFPIGMSTDGARWALYTGGSSSGRAYWYEGAVNRAIVPVPEEEPQLGTNVTAISPDGLTVAGRYNGTNGENFLWTPSTGALLLQRPWVSGPRPFLVADGGARVVFRLPNVTPSTAPQTWANGVWRLTPGFGASVIARRGRLVLGTLWKTSAPDHAAVWSETLGSANLADELTARGADLRGWTLTDVHYITADSRTIVGRGTAPGSSAARWWVATVEPFAAADIGKQGAAAGGDGELDNNDFIVFIDRFFGQDERADVGGAGALRAPDGQFDNNDFCVFIGLFFSREP